MSRSARTKAPSIRVGTTHESHHSRVSSGSGDQHLSDNDAPPLPSIELERLEVEERGLVSFMDFFMPVLR